MDLIITGTMAGILHIMDLAIASGMIHGMDGTVDGISALDSVMVGVMAGVLTTPTGDMDITILSGVDGVAHIMDTVADGTTGIATITPTIVASIQAIITDITTTMTMLPQEEM